MTLPAAIIMFATVGSVHGPLPVARFETMEACTRSAAIAYESQVGQKDGSGWSANKVFFTCVEISGYESLVLPASRP